MSTDHIHYIIFFFPILSLSLSLSLSLIYMYIHVFLSLFTLHVQYVSSALIHACIRSLFPLQCMYTVYMQISRVWFSFIMSCSHIWLSLCCLLISCSFSNGSTSTSAISYNLAQCQIFNSNWYSLLVQLVNIILLHIRSHTLVYWSISLLYYILVYAGLHCH